MAKNIIPYSSLSHARLRASQRRKWLINELTEHSDLPPGWVVEETPPGMMTSERPNISDYREERLGQLARLRWQLSSDVFILLERVTDAVLQLLDTRESEPNLVPITVKIERLRKFMGTRGLFPWRVVVCSYETENIVKGLTPLTDWLGVGVDIDEPRVLSPLGRCHDGYDGKDGLLGGIVQSRYTYGVTCQHVISSTCKSLAVHQNTSPNSAGYPFGTESKPTASAVHQNTSPKSASISITSAPDAVLLDSQNPCFESPRESAAIVSAATTSWLERCMSRRIPVRQTHPRSQGSIAGVVKATVSASTIEQRVYRFPQIEVIPSLTSYFYGLITFPLVKRRFSYPGDSGAWIRDSESGSWIGMVTAGDERGSTYASNAGCLLDYFSQLTNAQTFLMPATWSQD